MFGYSFHFLIKMPAERTDHAGISGNRPRQGSAVFTCPVNGLRVENAPQRSPIPTGAWTFQRVAVGRQFLSPVSQMDSAP